MLHNQTLPKQTNTKHMNDDNHTHIVQILCAKAPRINIIHEKQGKSTGVQSIYGVDVDVDEMFMCTSTSKFRKGKHSHTQKKTLTGHPARKGFMR